MTITASFLKRFWMDQSGAGAGTGDAIIIIALIVVALVGTVILMEDAVSQAFDNFWPG